MLMSGVRLVRSASLHRRPGVRMVRSFASSPNIVDVTEETFMEVVMQADRPVALDCYAGWSCDGPPFPPARLPACPPARLSACPPPCLPASLPPSPCLPLSHRIENQVPALQSSYPYVGAPQTGASHASR